ncbi:hypothetical protein [Sphingopyxis sp. PET50]|uniref:hypothetical protein n=1 Tax=Sphingopyxis sp. PET50 TaxID=2976533 RepID=UPI0021AFB28E|nr:hypothetical protein [Sphingopyxis sp. PET50]
MTRPNGYPTSTSIGKFADQMRDPDPANGRKAAREMRERSGGKWVFFNTENLTWPEEARVNQLADEIYGPLKEPSQ